MARAYSGLLVLLLLAGFAPVHASESKATAQCKALAGADFASIADAPARITEAQLVETTKQLIGDLGDPSLPQVAAIAVKHIGAIRPYCRVRGYVTSSVGFELLLPMENWNGKFLHVGCGDWCGTTAQVGLQCGRHPGYACIGSDMGHKGNTGAWFRTNPQAVTDFAYRATHVATLAGKAITERFYSSRPRKAYFVGCSTGGYQGMVEAQRFPADFDGIVAGAPDMDESDLAVRSIWIKQNFFDRHGRPVLNPEEIRLLHQAALARCDLDDGVKDGIIGDPVHCRFDPAELLCKPGDARHCLDARQVKAVRNIYGAPVNSKGVVLSTRGVFPGSELNWAEMFADSWGDDYFRETALLTTPGRQWTYLDFDFDRDYARSGVGTVFSDTDPDLRRFKAAGGKLISYQGGNDAVEIPGAIFAYYDAVEKTVGGRAATQDFFRLFAVPGMNHCTGGDGPFLVDYLSYLEAWVEQGRAPDAMTALHVSGLVKNESYFLNARPDPGMPIAFSRPLYPYPLFARYTGHGDPNNAASFEPAAGR